MVPGMGSRHGLAALAALAAAQILVAATADAADSDAPLAHPVVFVAQPPLEFGPGENGQYPRYRGFGAPIVRVTGANLFRLDPSGAVVNLTRRSNASIRNPDVSFDGTKVLYAMAFGQDGRWQIHEMNVDGTGDRRVSRDWNWNDLDPAYLPDGRIVFVSDRRKVVDPYLWLPSAQLHVMEADGTGVTQLSSNPGGESSPTALASGEIGFVRWDVRITDPWNPDPLDVSRFLPWRVAPDGAGDGHPAFGPHTVRDFTGGYLQAREIPGGSGRLVATATNDLYYFSGGSLVRLDPAGDDDDHRPEVLTGPHGLPAGTAFQGSWRDPYPTLDGRLLASFSAAPTFDASGLSVSSKTFALVLADGDGRFPRVLHDDPGIWEWEPVEVAARTAPPIVTPTLDRAQTWGVLNAMDVTVRGRNPSVPVPDVQGDVPDQPGLKVRIYRGKRAALSYGYGAVGYARVEPTLLGEAPVHADGSFAARVPANTPLLWEVVDAQGNVLVKERFWNQVLPGQVQTCNGCHSPHDGRTGRTTNEALASPAILVAEDPLPGRADTALEAAQVAVAEARAAFDSAALGGTPSPRVAARLDRAERVLARAETKRTDSEFAPAVRLARRAKADAGAVLRKLGAAPR